MARTRQYAERVNVIKMIKLDGKWRFAPVVERNREITRTMSWSTARTNTTRKAVIISSGAKTKSAAGSQSSGLTKWYPRPGPRQSSCRRGRRASSSPSPRDLLRLSNRRPSWNPFRTKHARPWPRPSTAKWNLFRGSEASGRSGQTGWRSEAIFSTAMQRPTLIRSHARTCSGSRTSASIAALRPVRSAPS
jgi:hypothetical protein